MKNSEAFGRSLPLWRMFNLATYFIGQKVERKKLALNQSKIF